jgi:uncharacterized protein
MVPEFKSQARSRDAGQWPPPLVRCSLRVVAEGWRATWRALPLLVTLVACEGNSRLDRPVSREDPVVPLDSGLVSIATDTDTITLRVEIAETEAQVQIGLMERTELGRDEGMLFVFDTVRSGEQGFWMFRTRIPLDIAYLDEAGTIVAVRSMNPCPSPVSGNCPSYPPWVPYRSALELNQGVLDSLGVTVGDRVSELRRY